MINFDGLLIGIVTFLIIGLFHPVVVKSNIIGGRNAGGYSLSWGF